MSEADPYQHLWPVLRDADVSFFFLCAATTLAFYEHLITIRLEVQQIWKRDVSGATLLFVMTRYIMLLNRIFVIVGMYPISDPSAVCSCNTVLWLQAISSSALITVMSAIGAIRVYALWGRDTRLLIVLMLAGMFPAFANLFFRSASSAYIIPTRFYSCQSAPTAMTADAYKTRIAFAVSIITRAVSIVSDGLVVALTWVKTYRVYTLTRRIRFRADYSALILRDGAIYFMAIAVLNFLAILYIVTTGTNLLNDLTVTLSAILMARFLLNLRDQRARIEDMSTFALDTVSFCSSSSSSCRPPTPSSLRFQSGMFDTMGGTLSVGSELDAEGEEGEETCVAPGEDDVRGEEKMASDGAGAWA
ncbi:hypothetical protein OH77DRAFT_1406126 [Trametes cingulata]|nr:hypothetical protein OH77DRAFT_1406126 [Trametes cingulata]